MYKNKTNNGLNNIAGKNIKKYRQALPGKPSQRTFADMLQIAGLDVDKNTIQRMENGTRFITDIDLKAIAAVLDISCDELLK